MVPNNEAGRSSYEWSKRNNNRHERSGKKKFKVKQGEVELVASSDKDSDPTMFDHITSFVAGVLYADDVPAIVLTWRTASPLSAFVYLLLTHVKTSQKKQ